ncbi:MAG: pyridoxamine 5'-phosphate oxidase family protein [Phycisphaerales bacterium]
MAEFQFVSYGSVYEEAWGRLRRAADELEHPMRLVVVATRAGDGHPDARTMVLRGADRDSHTVWTHTDCRSAKIRHLGHCPSVCVVAYDPEDGVQLRLYGEVAVHIDDEIARRHWEQLRMSSRRLYRLDARPGEPIRRHEDPIMQRATTAASVTREAKEPGFEYFCVLGVSISRIDWLQVQGDELRRAVMHADQNWKIEPVAA